jgi:hypothetical protein
MCWRDRLFSFPLKAGLQDFGHFFAGIVKSFENEFGLATNRHRLLMFAGEKSFSLGYTVRA